MSFAPGSRLGSFEIISAIGAGGMGEVYRAHDARLHRDVAIKVLPETVAADPERLARFEREARTLASLNHPHIAQIYGLEVASGPPSLSALIMELVEGEDLAARIGRGRMPVDEAIAVARQIAEALDAAHSSRIVHRDLKPANVRIRPDGVVKVLDFGLAKALDASDSAASIASSPTITSPAGMTRAGVMLGTAAYMSPEQARGSADKRADIWAFGCVLYEMLTGRRAFEGDTVADVLSAIVKDEPDWSRLPPDTPPRIVSLLQHCLRKDPARRLRDIGDAIARIDGTDGQSVTAGAAPPSSGRRWLAAGLVAAATAGVAAGYLLRRPEPAPLAKFHAALQNDGSIREPKISPDGTRAVYVGRSALHVHGFVDWTSRELEGTDGASRPFWSADGEWIGYFRNDDLLKVPSRGGSSLRLATLPGSQGRFGTNAGVWTADGNITVSTGLGPLLRVPDAGGTPLQIPYDDPEMIGLRDPAELPGGALVGTIHARSGIPGLGVLKDGKIRTVLDMPNVRNPSYSPSGHLVFQRGIGVEEIWAIPFSASRLAVDGEAFLIAAGSQPSIGANGALLFLPPQISVQRQLAWITLDGTIESHLGDPRAWTEGAAISPDGQRVLAAASDGIWLYDRQTGARSRITSGTDHITPAWVSGDTMVFVRTSPLPALMIKPVATVGGETVLAESSRFPRVTQDGRRVVFNRRPTGGGLFVVAWIDLDQPGQIHQLEGEHAGARFPSVSPDGSLVAYVSAELGRDEVFVTQLPDGRGKWQVSTEGGGWTLFSPTGDAVIYRAFDGAMMSASISRAAGSGEVRVGPPRKLFDWGTGWAPFYDLTRDGKGAIVAVPVGRTFSVPSLSVIQNWHREFQRR